jgi:plastocyanin
LRARVHVAAAFLALRSIFCLVSCGGSEDEEGRTTTVPGDAPVRIAGDDYSFDPETVIVTGGATDLELEFVNEGSLAHNVRVFQGDRELGGSPTFGGGQARGGRVTLPGPGEYELICTVGNHKELGMTGALELRK